MSSIIALLIARPKIEKAAPRYTTSGSDKWRVTLKIKPSQHAKKSGALERDIGKQKTAIIAQDAERLYSRVRLLAFVNILKRDEKACMIHLLLKETLK